jgi:protein O-mannosyl-transferase
MSVCVVLALAVLAVFSRVLHCGFVDYDDGNYVFSNQEVQRGLTPQSVRWALTTGESSNWHPVTWLSHEMDVELYGLKPAGHHLTSLFLHTANAVLLLLILKRMTGTMWRSAFVAAMFALHPLRVESVAWVAERKDVLSALFFMLAIGAYVRYAEKFKVQSSKFKVHYSLCLVFFVLGLMAKPMLVTLPFVLLLLDYWPLRRKDGPKRLLTEKIPFFLLAAASSVVTYLVQQKGGAVSTSFALNDRLANAVISYTRYLGKTFWPVHLAAYYPHPEHWPEWEVAAAAIFLALVTGLVIWQARGRPYLAVGWFWFLGMLVPAIGVVQVGLQSMADRYTYLPLVGVFIMVAWGANAALGERREGRRILALMGGLAVAACAALSSWQVRYWRDSETLFTHAIESTKGNYLMCDNLGYLLADKREYAKAEAWYQRALEMKPDYAAAHNNYGVALAKSGRLEEAIAQFRMAIANLENYGHAHLGLGNALAAQGKLDEAAKEYGICVALDPEDPQAHNMLGNVRSQQGKLEEAVAQYREASRLNPQNPETHLALGHLLAKLGRGQEAENEVLLALQQRPDFPQARQLLEALRAGR